MDSDKPKKPSRGRKRRLQLDDDDRDTRHPPPFQQETSASTSSKTQSAKSSGGTTSRRKQNSSSIAKHPRTSRTVKPRPQASGSGSTSSNPQQTVSSTAPTLPGLDAADESNSTLEDATQRPAASSPEPNCAICLGQMENKSFTDSCFHQFCFVCLLEWSKVKAECPLCKQSFKSIVHNVRSYKDYDQYELPRPENRLPMYDFAAPGGVRFRYRTTVTDHRYAHIADQINQEIENRLLQRPSRSLPIWNYRRLRQPANSDFRRSVYLQGLKLTCQQSDTRRRVRETSPSFFRENPAQTHRLVPWVNRELNALLHGHGEQVAFVLDLIMGLIKRYTIDSEEFYQHLFPYTGRHTRQFMHEFLMFAKSPYHMAAYDRHISYEPNSEPRHDSDSDLDHRAGDDGNDSDVIVVSPGNSPVRSRNPSPPPPRGGERLLDNTDLRRNWTDDPQFFPGFNRLARAYGNEDLPSMNPYTELGTDSAPTSASGWDSPTPGPSQWPFPGYLAGLGLDPPSSRSDISLPGRIIAFGGPSLHGESFAPPMFSTGSSSSTLNLFERQPSVAASSQLTTSQSNPIHCHDTDSDSSSSDVEIVNVEKPWTERSPIHLSSGGDTDYDVMITGMTHVNDPVKTEKKKKKKKHKYQTEENNSERRKDSNERTDSSKERYSRKKHHRSRSGSLPRAYRSDTRSRSRTRSVSPLRLTIFRSPEYQHKKFGYRTSNETLVDRYHHSGRRHYRSRSPSTSDLDTESRVSITSHRRSSSSIHSHVEILEYRKKSSKSKKKKHKHDRNKEDLSGYDKNEKKHKKNKKHRRLTDDETEETEGTKSRTKHKSKKKKTHKHKKKSNKQDKKLDQINDSDGIAEKFEYPEKKKDSIYTSDSESDSNTDAYQNDDTDEQQMEKSSSEVKAQNFGAPGLEFVEVDAAQAAVLDEELDSINKTLNANDYINSLLTENKVHSNEDIHRFENVDPNKMVNPNEVFNQKTFKKHPYGHKKSSKNNLVSTTSNISASSSTITTVASLESRPRVAKTENYIQSNDISSCSDIDFEKQLPSFFTFSNRSYANEKSPSLSPNVFNIRSWTHKPISKKTWTTTSSAYESPTSTATYLEKEHELDVHKSQIDNEPLDVDAVSYDSDVDVVGESLADEPFVLNEYQTNCLKIPKTSASSYVDVVGDSDHETEEFGRNKKQEPYEVICGKDTKSDMRKETEDLTKIDVESDDSEVECSLVEGHKTFEICEEADNDLNIEETDEIPSITGNSINLVQPPEDEIVIDDPNVDNLHSDSIVANKAISVVSDDEEVELGYSCDEDENDGNRSGQSSISVKGNDEDNMDSDVVEENEEKVNSDLAGVPEKVNCETDKINTDLNSADIIDNFCIGHVPEVNAVNQNFVKNGHAESHLSEREKYKQASESVVKVNETGAYGSDCQNEIYSAVALHDNGNIERNVNSAIDDNQAFSECSHAAEQKNSSEHMKSCATSQNQDLSENSAADNIKSDEQRFESQDAKTSSSSDLNDFIDTHSDTQAGSVGFSWTANPLYQAQHLSVSEFDETSQEHQYLVDSHREQTSESEASPYTQNSLTSPDTEETFSSVELWDRPYSPNNREGDFQAED